MHVQEGDEGLEKDHQAINHHKGAYNDKSKASGTFDWLDWCVFEVQGGSWCQTNLLMQSS